MVQETKTKGTSCPTCENRVAAPKKGADKATFPFCCERCRAVDLGHWLDERYTLNDGAGSVEH